MTDNHISTSFCSGDHEIDALSQSDGKRVQRFNQSGKGKSMRTMSLNGKRIRPIGQVETLAID